MTLTDIIILLIIGGVIYLILHYELKSNRGCHCAQMRRVSGLKKFYNKTK